METSLKFRLRVIMNLLVSVLIISFWGYGMANAAGIPTSMTGTYFLLGDLPVNSSESLVVRDGSGNVMNNSTLIFSSDDISIATVDNMGHVGGVSPGAVNISASDGVNSVSIAYNVYTPVYTSSDYGIYNLNIPLNATDTIRSSDQHSNIFNVIPGSLSFISNNNGVLTVDNEGLVTGMSTGSTSVSISDGVTSNSLPYTVYTQTITSAQLSYFTGGSMPIGAFDYINAYDQHGNSMNPDLIVFGSRNTAVATVMGGDITAVGSGTAQIFGTYNGIEVTFNVTVYNPTISTLSPGYTGALLPIDRVNGTFTDSITPIDTNGYSLDPTILTWSSGNTGIATVDANGHVVPTGTGDVVITASGGINSATITYHIYDQTVATLTVTSPIDPPGIVPLDNIQLGIDAFDSNSHPVLNLDNTAFDWLSSDTGIATVSNSGVVSGVSEGLATITASTGAVNNSIGITVGSNWLSSLAFDNPIDPTILTGATLQLNVSGYDQLGNILNPLGGISWSSSNNGVVSVDANGLITGLNVGTAYITASSGTVSATNTITVTQTPVFTHLLITPPITSTIGVGQTLGLTAVAYSQTGGIITPTPAITWNSSNNLVATVSSTGIVTGIGAGTASISATNGSITNSINITVDPGAPLTIAASVVNSSYGAISSPGVTSVSAGGSITYTMSTGFNGYLQDVLVDGVSVGTPTTYTFSGVSSSHTIQAIFDYIYNQQLTMNVSASTGGTISPSGIYTVSYLGSQTWTPTANTGYHLVSMVINGVNYGARTITYNNITTDMTVVANFAQDNATNNIISTNGTGGTISPLGTNAVNFGSGITFTIAPDIGYLIDKIYIDGIQANLTTGTSSGGTYVFTNVLDPHTIDVQFIQDHFNVTASAGIGGTISPSGVVSVPVNGGTTFDLTPSAGYLVTDVILDGVSQGESDIYIYTISNIRSDHTLQAVFSRDSFNITASAGTGGTISPTGITVIPTGGSGAYTITPDLNYHVVDILVDGVSQGAITSFTFTGVIADHTISASFAADVINPIISSVLNLNSGWNLITPPVQTLTSTGAPLTYTAESFGQLVGADMVTQWVNASQQYMSHIVGFPVNNFTIENSNGFFVHTLMHTVTLSGTLIPQTTPLTGSGWNLVGFTDTTPVTANAFGLSIPGVDMVSKFDSSTQQWVSHIMNFPLNDFTINQGDGIFIHKP